MTSIFCPFSEVRKRSLSTDSDESSGSSKFGGSGSVKDGLNCRDDSDNQKKKKARTTFTGKSNNDVFRHDTTVSLYRFEIIMNALVHGCKCGKNLW